MSLSVSYNGQPLRFEDDCDSEYRKDHAQAAKFAIDVSVTNYLRLLRVPNEECAKCIEEVRAVLRNYEPS